MDHIHHDEKEKDDFIVGRQTSAMFMIMSQMSTDDMHYFNENSRFLQVV
jgi:hypothetical protein